MAFVAKAWYNSVTPGGQAARQFAKREGNRMPVSFALLTPGDALWERLRAYAKGCSWSAGKALSEAMREGAFADWERVIAAVRDGEVCGYCTVAKTDCIPDAPYTPYIGFLFVGEPHRGHRLSERMIGFASDYLKGVGFDRVYLVSDHENLYERYGFAVIDRRMASWGAMQKIYMRRL